MSSEAASPPDWPQRTYAEAKAARLCQRCDGASGRQARSAAAQRPWDGRWVKVFVCAPCAAVGRAAGMVLLGEAMPDIWLESPRHHQDDEAAWSDS